MSILVRLSSINVAALAAGEESTETLNVKGLVMGMGVKRLNLVSIPTLTRGAGATDISPEQWAYIYERIGISHKHFEFQTSGMWNTVRNQVLHGHRDSINGKLALADTTYYHSMNIDMFPFAPPGKKVGEQRSMVRAASEVEGLALNVTIKNPFDVLDVPSMTMKLELWAELVGNGGSPGIQFLTVEQTKLLPPYKIISNSNFSGDIQNISDMVVTLGLLKNRNYGVGNDFTSMSLRLGAVEAYSNANPLQIDMIDAEHNASITFYDDKVTSGNEMLVNFPSPLDGPVSFSKTQDVRTFGEGGMPVKVTFHDRADATPFPTYYEGLAGAK